MERRKEALGFPLLTKEFTKSLFSFHLKKASAFSLELETIQKYLPKVWRLRGEQLKEAIFGLVQR